MKLARLDYTLPKSFIAQSPAKPRDHSRLLVIDRKNKLPRAKARGIPPGKFDSARTLTPRQQLRSFGRGIRECSNKKLSHHFFYELPKLLTPNDVLVFNKTKVFPARLYGKKEVLRQSSGRLGGGKAEVLLLRQKEGSLWEAITKPGFFVGDKIFFEDFVGTVTKRINYLTEIKFNITPPAFLRKIDLIGKTPIPPYIKPLPPEKNLSKDYQTVYAKEVGSAAAPTAGLHFTKKLINALKKKGVQTEFLTLHVGLGTFAPIKEEYISKHKIYSEYFELNKNTTKRLNYAKREKKRIIAVGTTTARVLETCAIRFDKDGPCQLAPQKGETSLFIYPPYKFRFVDSLITNFHLPKSSLLALVSAFVSYPNAKEEFKDFKSSLLGRAYQEAVKERYRFFSFGDACLIF